MSKAEEVIILTENDVESTTIIGVADCHNTAIDLLVTHVDNPDSLNAEKWLGGRIVFSYECYLWYELERWEITRCEETPQANTEQDHNNTH